MSNQDKRNVESNLEYDKLDYLNQLFHWKAMDKNTIEYISKIFFTWLRKWENFQQNIKKKIHTGNRV